jgi:hypothetical protein
MEKQHTSQSSEQAKEEGQIIITLELESDADPALALAVGNTTVVDILHEQYTLRQTYTGRKGGFFVQFVVPAMQFLLANQAEIIADLSGLITIFGGVLPILQKMQHAHEKQVGKEESERSPIKIEVEIDGASIKIEAPDLIQAESALNLARNFHSTHPDKKPTPQSPIAIRGQVPPRKRPTRR